ncbi:hypothetical protein MXB_4087 [Myxobolus squamalis]|nr:hypothetical protein MXB_4087 [Myxobolus squamalis]
MRIEKCYFCSCSVYPGHGLTFVRNDSKRNGILEKLDGPKLFASLQGKNSASILYLNSNRKEIPLSNTVELFGSILVLLIHLIFFVIAIKKVEEVANKRKELYLLKRFDQTRERTTENNELEVIKDKVLITEAPESSKNKIFDAVRLHRSNELKSKTEPLMFMMEST